MWKKIEELDFGSDEKELERGGLKKSFYPKSSISLFRFSVIHF